LKPLTLYYYGFDGGDKGSFHTFGVGRYSFKVLTSLLEVHPKIGFGSCAATGSSSQVWSDLRKENLHLFIHMGDLQYGFPLSATNNLFSSYNNINEDNVTRFHDSYQEVFDGEEQRKFYYSTPVRIFVIEP
jgi:phosphodiesterase/alkaline phosphatase D-like protein